LKKYKNHIAEIIARAAGIGAEKIEPFIEIPPSEEMGDLAFPCFTLARHLRKSPQTIAQELLNKITPQDPIERIEADGAYLNFSLRHASLIADVISEVSEFSDDYGKRDTGKGKTVVVEYSSPNIAKPFGIGHLRSTVIGAALKRIFLHLGYDVVSINHLGDWGTQFGKLLYAYKRWGDESRLQADPVEHLYDLYVKIHQEEEKNKDIADASRAEFRKLEDGDSESLKLWKSFSDLSKREFAQIYRMLGVEFDSDDGESFYIDKIPETEKILRDSGLLSESREATIVDLEKFDMPPMLIRKSDDTTLYATRDLAAAIYRKRKYDFHKMIYVVGVAQSLYFRQLSRFSNLWDFPGPPTVIMWVSDGSSWATR